MTKELRFGDIFYTSDFVANGSFASLKKNVVYSSKKDYAILVRTTDNTKNWKGDFVYVNRKAYEFLAKSRLHPGDLVIANVGYPGKCFLCPNLEQPITLGPNAILVRPLDKQIVNMRYFYYYTASVIGQSQIARIVTNTAQKKFNKTSYRDLTIRLPKIDIQKITVNKLDLIDRLRQSLRAEVAAYGELGESLFLEMFGDPLTRKTWPIKEVSSLAAKFKGAMRTGPFGSNLKHSEFVDDGIPVLGIDNAVLNKFAWGKRRFITLEKYNQLKRYTVKPNDVIVTIMGTVGRVAVIPDNIGTAINTKHLAAITLDRELAHPVWFAQSLLLDPSIRYQLKIRSKGAIMDGLNLTIIKELKIPLPPLPLQRRFAARIAEIEKLKAKAESALSEAEDLFAAVLQESFGG